MNRIRQKVFEVPLKYMYDAHKLGCVLHTTFDTSQKKMIVLVPGLFGDRCDTRALFVRLARVLAENKYTVVRFDFIGGGINIDEYSINNFEVMTKTLVHVVKSIQEQFPWLIDVGLIGFSEGGKLCVKALEWLDVSFIGFCNALLAQEELLLPIKRPQLIEGRMVYDSDFGSWTNFEIVECYDQWFVNDVDLDTNCYMSAVYSDSDSLTKKSLELIKHCHIPLRTIEGADHLFTNEEWCKELCRYWIELLLENWKTSISDMEEYETFIDFKGETICMKVKIYNDNSPTLLFVHGLGQNKCGPSFLYAEIAYHFSEYNCVFFDFIGSGDSSGDLSKCEYDDYLEQLDFILESVCELLPNSDITLVASGAANSYVCSLSNVQDCGKIFICPCKSNLWSKLIECKDNDIIDTHFFFEKFDWIEEEFRILGNVYNRSKGLCVRSNYLRSIELANIALEKYELFDSDGIYVIDRCGNKSFVKVKDKSHLLMSAKSRRRAILQLRSVMDNHDM